MKKTLFVIALLSSRIIRAEEPLCKTTAGQMLTFTVSNTIFIGDEARPFMEMKKSLKDEFSSLCKTDKSSNDIIAEMYNRCFKLTQEKIKNKESKFHFEKACDIAYTAATYYAEGFEQAKKENSENGCDDKNAVNNPGRSVKDIENDIPPGIPEKRTKALKK
ncbi:MAG: hypothetical protein H7281_05785 [Bacteriovorax sp.]|nr:hypothetical protein [Bacteriovorax sp.]